MTEVLFSLHNFSTYFLTGLIWFVQLVHYPLFAEVPENGWPKYALEHQRRTSWVVIPPMLAEIIVGFFLVLGIGRPDYFSAMVSIVLFTITVLIWVATFIVSVPCHARLGEGYNREVIDRLVRTNWLRTFLWSGRSVILLYLLIAGR